VVVADFRRERGLMGSADFDHGSRTNVDRRPSSLLFSSASL
jgi:hypothetical protein